MIETPENDVTCLEHLHDFARTYAAHPVIRRCALAFESPKEVALFLRHLPFRLDLGRPGDGPRVPCTPSQRLRLLPHSLNCYEGTGNYLLLAEALDPNTRRSSATIRLPAGYHTFPIERNAPVNLDPYTPRNAIAAGHSLITSARAEQHPVTWFASIAANAPESLATKTDVSDGWRQISRAIRSGIPLDNPDAVRTFLDVGSRQSHLWGPPGAYLAHLLRSKLAPLLSLDPTHAQETPQETPQETSQARPALDLDPFDLEPLEGPHSTAAHVLSDSGPRPDNCR